MSSPPTWKIGLWSFLSVANAPTTQFGSILDGVSEMLHGATTYITAYSLLLSKQTTLNSLTTNTPGACLSLCLSVLGLLARFPHTHGVTWRAWPRLATLYPPHAGPHHTGACRWQHQDFLHTAGAPSSASNYSCIIRQWGSQDTRHPPEKITCTASVASHQMIDSSLTEVKMTGLLV